MKLRKRTRAPESDQGSARLRWREFIKVDHYRLDIDALTQPMEVREEAAGYGADR